MLSRIRNVFVAGLAVLLPVGATVYVLLGLFRFADGLLDRVVWPLLGYEAGRRIPGVGFVLTVLVVFLTGLLATNILGRRLIAVGERFLLRMPVARTIYGTLKQLIDGLMAQDRAAFRRVALVEYPRKGMYAIAFVTREGLAELDEKSGEELVGLFLPTTPNPTSGLLILVPRRDVTLLDMSVEEGVKLVISGGMVVPDRLAASQAAAASARTAAEEDEDGRMK